MPTRTAPLFQKAVSPPPDQPLCLVGVAEFPIITEVELDLVDRADAGIVRAPFLVIATDGVNAIATGLVKNHIVPQAMPTTARDMQSSFTVSGFVRLASGIANFVKLKIRRDSRPIPFTGKNGVANGNMGCV